MEEEVAGLDDVASNRESPRDALASYTAKLFKTAVGSDGWDGHTKSLQTWSTNMAYRTHEPRRERKHRPSFAASRTPFTTDVKKP